MEMKNQIILVLKKDFESKILRHKTNVEVMINNPMAIHDHTDLMSAIENEITSMAEYMDKLEVIEKHFSS